MFMWKLQAFFIVFLSYSIQLSFQLKYVWGDALDDPLALDPNGQAYPWELASKIAGRQARSPRLFFKSDENINLSHNNNNNLLSPQETRQILLKSLESLNGDILESNNQNNNNRQGRSASSSSSENSMDQPGPGCVPSRLCSTTYNTTAPLYGMSLTSGKPVTIVQKFPDLLQQVVFQVCKTQECEVLHGECVQTYLPYLFLVIPLGPVTLTGQDYVLVESGCVCQPKYAQKYTPPPLPFIQPIQTK